MASPLKVTHTLKISLKCGLVRLVFPDLNIDSQFITTFIVLYKIRLQFKHNVKVPDLHG